MFLYFEYIVFGALVIIPFICLIIMKLWGGFEQKESHYMSQMRKCESPIERKLYRSLSHNNHSVVTQYPVGRYRLDMAIPHLKIAIEADGKAYHSSPSQKAHDRRRDAFLRSRGWKVVRISGSEIYRNSGSAVRKVNKAISQRQ